jgi:protocatechuate 3,4-dioxygenase beta subunit
VTTLAVPGVGHTDTWIIDDATSRASAQDWLFSTVAARPGTHAIRGRVTDSNGDGVADATIAVGEFHVTRTDVDGYYALRGLLPGDKLVACSHPQLSCAAQAVQLADSDLALDFAAM